MSLVVVMVIHGMIQVLACPNILFVFLREFSFVSCFCYVL